MASTQRAVTSAWSPLYESIFRTLWIAALVSNIGTWMQNVGGAWLMTSLTPSSVLVALMQTATSLPIFLVGLFAGAIADVVDRRLLLIIAQSWMLAAAALLSVLTFLGATNPWSLLILTFALGLGAAIASPAWQAITPDLVSREELPAAVALNGVSINLARAIGPALGGFVVAAAGPVAVFLLNALSFLGIILVLYWWHPSPEENQLPAESLFGALRAGLRYVRYAPAIHTVLIRTAAFIFSASALWALMPVVARYSLKLGAGGYGILLGCLGLGAVAGAIALPRVWQKISVDLVLASATVVFALATVTLGYLHNLILLFLMMVISGIAWIAFMSSMNVAAQVTAPTWVRARALGTYLLVFQGGLAIGSAVWGAIADRWGADVALAVAAIGLAIGLATALRWRVAEGENLNLTPSLSWPEPHVVSEPNPEEGPVLVTVEYHPELEHVQEFIQAMYKLSRIRRRDGAIRWGLFQDTANPDCYFETFLSPSWAEHLRQHERVTIADREIEDRVHFFEKQNMPRIITHFISVPRPKNHD